MGHPQPATPIQTDNTCAAGIANGTINQRRSKAIDMRFYSVRDRVAQGQIIVHWRRGTDNLADYFTKLHSPVHYRLMRPHYLHRSTTPIRGGEGVLIPLDRLSTIGSLSTKMIPLDLLSTIGSEASRSESCKNCSHQSTFSLTVAHKVRTHLKSHLFQVDC
jgi:hypothetical protein